MRTRTGIAVLMVTLASWAYGGPNTITYQGSVLLGPGTPVADNTYAMRFSIFTLASGGSNVWQESDMTVSVQSGLFATALGDGTGFGALFANNNNLGLEVEVDLNRNGIFEPNEKYAPRQKLAGAAWAINADTLDGSHASNFWRTTGNAGITSGTHFLGTTDNKPLDFRVNNARALRIQPTTDTANLIGGHSGNSVAPGVLGATIAGGGTANRINRVMGNYGTISGGAWNTVSGQYAVVAGGTLSTASAVGATIGGGAANLASGVFGTVAGGGLNSATSAGATVSGGAGNSARADYATIGGGNANATTGSYATIAGGRTNIAANYGVSVAGGESNVANGYATAIGGGRFNIASGGYATVPGGRSNTAAGNYSMAAGFHAKALHQGTFIWGDSHGFDVSSTADNQFLVRASGGMMLTPNNGALQPNAQLHVVCDSNLGRPQLNLEETQPGDFARLRLTAPVLGPLYWDVAASGDAFNIYNSEDAQNILQLLPNDATNLLYMRNGARLTNGGVWTNASDRAAKANFDAVDSRQVLERVATMPIQTWNYRTEQESTRHMGPTAQDFYAAFSLGDSDKGIGTVDADGVALAAIQGLYELMQQKDAEIAALRAEKDNQIAAQQKELAGLKERLATIETLLTANAHNR